MQVVFEELTVMFKEADRSVNGSENTVHHKTIDNTKQNKLFPVPAKVWIAVCLEPHVPPASLDEAVVLYRHLETQSLPCAIPSDSEA